MIKVILDKSKCIGCGSCQIICPEFFELDKNRKACLKNSKIKAGSEKEELKVDELECIEEAIKICPVECIHIE